MNSPAYIHNRASAAAAQAAADYLNANPGQWYPCGFAWVLIKPARGAYVNYLKSIKVGSNGCYGGWEIWNPSGNGSQCMDAKMAGARAYAAEVERLGGPKMSAQSRID
jgi:hypothetical protein